MAKTAAAGFDEFLSRITPTENERSKASKHHAEIEAKLDAGFGLYRMFESGSLRHGTGVSSYSDVDLFASLGSAKASIAQAEEESCSHPSFPARD